MQVKLKDELFWQWFWRQNKRLPYLLFILAFVVLVLLHCLGIVPLVRNDAVY